MRAGAYQVPRPETYVRDLGTPKRRGCQNSILDARSLRRGLHPPHLHPRYKTDAAKGRGENGQFHGAGHVSRKSKNTGEKAKASSPVLFGSIGIIPRVGHGVGQAVDPHFDPHLFQRFCNKKAPKTEGLTVVRNYKSCGWGRGRCDRKGHAVFLRPREDSAIMGSASTGISTSSTKLKMISTFCLRLPPDLSGA